MVYSPSLCSSDHFQPQSHQSDYPMVVWVQNGDPGGGDGMGDASAVLLTCLQLHFSVFSSILGVSHPSWHPYAAFVSELLPVQSAEPQCWASQRTLVGAEQLGWECLCWFITSAAGLVLVAPHTTTGSMTGHQHTSLVPNNASAGVATISAPTFWAEHWHRGMLRNTGTRGRRILYLDRKIYLRI